MITGFNPAVSNNRSQRQNFCAVNKGFFEAAQKAQQKGIGQSELIQDLTDKFIFGDISKVDTIDTLKAFKGIFPEGFHAGLDKEINWTQNYK